MVHSRDPTSLPAGNVTQPDAEDMPIDDGPAPHVSPGGVGAPWIGLAAWATDRAGATDCRSAVPLWRASRRARACRPSSLRRQLPGPLERAPRAVLRDR